MQVVTQLVHESLLVGAISHNMHKGMKDLPDSHISQQIPDKKAGRYDTGKKKYGTIFKTV